MTWTKLGDEFGDAAADLSDAAVRTHVDALMWSNRRLLDLTVPKKDLRRFAFSPSVNVTDPDGCSVVRELIAAGWWEDTGDSWLVGVRWPEWQLERAQVEQSRQRETERKRRQRAHNRGDHSLCASPCFSDPVPSRVAPGVPGGTRARVARLPVPPGVPPGTPGGTDSRKCAEHQLPKPCRGCAADAKAAVG